MHSDQDIVLSVLNPRRPIRLVKNPYLYLQILPGQSDIQLTRSCTQSGDKLNTSEPQIFLSGSPVTSQDECLPYLLAQHTPPFLKSYARIHTFPGKVCPVNAIRRGKGYVRVSVDTPDLKREGPLNVKVGMTLLDDVIIAFRYNPYPKSHWRWDGESTDIRYFGSPVIIPPNFITELEYNNTYEAPLSSKITAVVVSHSSNPVFYVYPQEWKPGQFSLQSALGGYDIPVKCLVDSLKGGEGGALHNNVPWQRERAALPLDVSSHDGADRGVSGVDEKGLGHALAGHDRYGVVGNVPDRQLEGLARLPLLWVDVEIKLSFCHNLTVILFINGGRKGLLSSGSAGAPANNRPGAAAP